MKHITYSGMLRHETNEIADVLIRKGWVDAPPPELQEGQRCDWIDGQWVVSAAVDPVPQEVPMWALKEVCVSRNHMVAIDAALASLPEPLRVKATLRWEYKDTISRGSSMISALQAILGWSDAYVDELFVAADTLAKS